MALYAFDGTWNSEEVEDSRDTNVVKFKELYVGNNVEYKEGVGTRFGLAGKVFGGVFGMGGRTRIDEMYDELCRNYAQGDTLIDIVGFSRGAALAVHFANKIGEEGVKISDNQVEKPMIRFLGLWDIVGSFGLAFDTVIDFQSINLGWNIDTVHGCVENCFHAMALDERRETFNVTRLDEHNRYAKIEEVWFRGVHSDIGGGNENVERSNIALQWMLDRAIGCGLPIDTFKADSEKYSAVNLHAPIFENKDPQRDPRRIVLPTDKLHRSAEPQFLKPGESHTCTVQAMPKYNWSGVTIEKGQTYRFSVPADQKWTDKKMECGPEGWRTDELPWYKEGIVNLLEGRRRHQNANWFALIGALGDEDDDLFIIGDCSKPYTANRTADLYLFANDLLSMYHNNKGFLTVTITRQE